MPAAIAETLRLVIRHLAPGDVPALAAIWADPMVTHYMGGPRDFQKISDSLREDLNATTQARFDLWPVIEKASGLVVGHCGLLDKEVDGRPEVELVYVIAAEAWERGYATEAAAAMSLYAKQTLCLKRLVSLIDTDNLRSQRVAQKVGMGLERDVIRPHGTMLLYSVELAPLTEPGN